MVFTILVILLLYSLRCKRLDKASLITIFIYGVSYLIKMLNWMTILIIENKKEVSANDLYTTEETHLIENIIVADKVAAFFLTLVVYFFVFQMQLVYLKCESDDYHEFMKLKSYSQRLQALMFVTTFLIFGIEMFFIISCFINQDNYYIGSP